MSIATAWELQLEVWTPVNFAVRSGRRKWGVIRSGLGRRSSMVITPRIVMRTRRRDERNDYCKGVGGCSEVFTLVVG